MISVLYKWTGPGAKRLRNGVVSGMMMLTLGVSATASGADAPAAPARQPQPTLRRWIEIGKASWYGLRFQGKRTANGEAFDMNSLTCAHRNLPLGSWVRVTNLKNRRSIFVRVNDRGPVPEDRVVDLSYAAAQAVGLHGVGKVKLEPVRRNDPQMARELMAQLRVPAVPNFRLVSQ
ncbi:MAG: septal ring lytic transglycosylase RlpA family protein [Acidobacteriota bacterium]|nr:septal ring lytic transglycosylase RlpA family protein [Acidobacteriota bacterium]